MCANICTYFDKYKVWQAQKFFKCGHFKLGKLTISNQGAAHIYIILIGQENAISAYY